LIVKFPREHLVLSPRAREPIPFRLFLDSEAPGVSHGVGVDKDGNGVLRDGRMYQLVREHDRARERTVEITFLEPARRTRSRSGSQKGRRVSGPPAGLLTGANSLV
jgi:Thioredoxin like C-terminal domain